MGRNSFSNRKTLGWGITAAKTNQQVEDATVIFRFFSKRIAAENRPDELRSRFQNCIRQRETLQSNGNVYRLIHGENDIAPNSGRFVWASYMLHLCKSWFVVAVMMPFVIGSQNMILYKQFGNMSETKQEIYVVYDDVCE